MNKSFTFDTIIDQFKNKAEYDKFISECLDNYDLKVYRVNTMTKQQAINYYNDLKDKYDSGIYQRTPTYWYQNERRLFIWFIVCYIKFNGNKALDNDNNWEILSDIFFGKDSRLLKYQYMGILKRGGRVIWNQDEDEILVQAFNKFPRGQWNQIAKEIFFSGKSTQFKSPKHCRERWNNHLNTQIKKDPWVDEEDLQILKLVKEKGKKWSQIAQSLGFKRTEHQIKNRYNSLMNHTEKKQTEDETLENLISSYTKKKEISKFTFFNNIIVVKEEQKGNPPVVQKKSLESNDERREHVTLNGMSIVYCGKNNGVFNQSITTNIEERLFGSNYLSDLKIQTNWMEKSFLHTPGQNFLGDSRDYEKKLTDIFMLSQKGSIEKSASQFTQSMDIFKLPKSDMSQQYKILSSSCTDMRTATNYDFSTDLKQI